MAAICFTLLCTSLPIALWKEHNDSLHLEKWLLCETCHGRHIEIQDGRHIIRHAVFKGRQMSLTLSVVTEKVFISPFRSGSDGSHIQYHDDVCIAGPFHCL